MRKGYALIEILVSISLIAVLMVIMAKPIGILMGDIPRLHRDFQVYSRINDLTKQVRKDIESADSAGVDMNDPNTVVLDIEGGEVRYQFRQGSVVRIQRLSDDKESNANEGMWSFPRADIDWRLWQEDGRGYAMEICTSVKRMNQGRWKKSFSNSHLFFVGTAGNRSIEQ